ILLVGVQSSGHAPPQDQPFDLALQLSWKRQSGHIDLARLRDPPIIRRRAEAGSQAEAEKVEPAGFVSRPFFPAVRHLRERVTELANSDHGPSVFAVAEDRFDLADKILRSDRLIFDGLARPAKDGADHTFGLSQRFFGDYGLRLFCCGLIFMFIFNLRLRAAQLELEAPAMIGIERFAPEFERANFSETHGQTHGQLHLTRLLAVAQSSDQRRVTMDFVYVKRQDVAVRVVTGGRAVERESDGPVGKRLEFPAF